MDYKEKVRTLRPSPDEVCNKNISLLAHDKDTKKDGDTRHLDFTHLDDPIPGLVKKPKYLIDLADEEGNNVEYLLKYRGVGMLPRGDIHAITGAKKSGKTTFTLILIVAMMTGNYQGFETVTKQPLRILVVDTEQNIANVKLNARRIHKAAGLDPSASCERLRFLALRRYTWLERLNIIQSEIKTFRPDYVLIDGISDLTKSANDEESSIQAIQTIMTLSADYNCGISGILHLNKTDKRYGTETMRGHEGTELGNKATETYILRRTVSGTTEVEQTDCRNEKIEDFSFLCEGSGEDKTISIISSAESKEGEYNDLLDYFRGVFARAGKDEITAGELYTLMGTSENTAQKKCSDAKSLGILEQRMDGKRRPYRIAVKTAAEEFASVVDDDDYI